MPKLISADSLDLETLRFVRDDTSHGAVAIITLNRPESANALDDVMTRELFEVALACDQATDIRAVLLTAAGDRLFCGGGDLKVFAEAADQAGALVNEMVNSLHGAMTRFARMAKPVLVAVNGNAGGAGVSLTAMADLAIAADTACFTMAYTRVGLTPDGSSTFFLPRLIGLRRTAELALTNRTLTAQEALDWGLVNRVVPATELHDKALDWARELAAGPTGAFAATKRLLLDSLSTPLETQMEHEARAIISAVTGTEARAGIAGFLSGRPATDDNKT